MNADETAVIFEEVRSGSSHKFLARADLDLRVTGMMGRTLLHEAIAFERHDIAAALIERGVPLDAADDNGQTALHYAGTYSNRSIAAALLERGADPNLPDRFGNNPLWSSALARQPDFELIRLLAISGADPRHRNKAGRSVLDFARQSEDRALWISCTGSEDGFEEKV